MVKFTEDDCEKWRINPLINPLTKRAIQKDKGTYNEIKKNCDNLKPKSPIKSKSPVKPKSPVKSKSPIKFKSPVLGKKKSNIRKADCIENYKWIVGKGCFEYIQPKMEEKIKSSTPVLPKDYLILGDENKCKGERFAIFDFDNTLVTTKNGSPFAKDRYDWTYRFSNVPLKLNNLYKQGYNVAIRTDQTKAFKIEMIKDVIADLKIPIFTIIGISPQYKKPDVSLAAAYLPNVEFSKSFYVGDAAGRKEDWSNVDLEFALSLGLDFKTPEEYFSSTPRKQPSPVIEKIKPDTHVQKDEIVIMVGIPGSGKSTIAKSMLPLGYEIISGDTAKTWQKMIAALKKSYEGGKRRFVIDATNVTPEHRKRYIDFGDSVGLPSKCIYVDTPVKVALARNELRDKKVPPVAIHILNKKLIVPSESEGCTVEIYNDTGKVEMKRQETMKTPILKDKKETVSKIDPMLAKNYEGQIDPVGWWHSEKLDGVRAVWNKQDFKSRNQNIFTAPDWYKEYLPTNNSLDGELFSGRGQFQKTVGYVKKHIPVDEEWKKIKYMVFDLPEDKSPFEQRYQKLEAIIEHSCNNDPECPLELVKQTKIKDKAHLLDLHKDITKQGGEGSMLRQPGSYYEQKRSSTLLKLKDFEETDAVVLKVVKGSGKYKNVMGNLEVQLVDDPNIKFSVGSGFTDAQRKLGESLFRKGIIIRVQYQGKTDSGVPRFPVYTGIHIDRGLDDEFFSSKGT